MTSLGGRLIPVNDSEGNSAFSNLVASSSVRAHSLTSDLLTARATPRVSPQVVVPIMATLGMPYFTPSVGLEAEESRFSPFSPSLRSLPAIRRLMLSRCITMIITDPTRV